MHVIDHVIVSEIDMSAGNYSIGRNAGNDLQLNDGVVSGEHAVINFKADECLPEMFDITITDLGSTNGTYVNNESIKEKKLKHGDIIRLGAHEFKIFDDQSHTHTQTEYYIPEGE